MRHPFLLVVTALTSIVLLAPFHSASAQEEVPRFTKITSRQWDPFKATEQNVVRGMWFNMFAGKSLPKWKDGASFMRAKLPTNLDDHRRAAWQREALKMETERGFGVRRMLHLLQIKLRDGRFIYFADRYTGQGEHRQVDIVFTYKGYDKGRRFYRVDWDWYENGGSAFISADTGLAWSLDGGVYPSPDGSRLVGLDNYGGPEQFTVLHLKVGRANYEIEENGSPFIRYISSQNVNDMHWEGDSTIHLRRNLDTQVLLRRTNNQWKIEVLSEPIPETVNCSWSWSGNFGFPDLPQQRLCRAAAVDAGLAPSPDVPDSPIPQVYVYTIHDPIHGRVNPDWLCIFENRNC